MSRSNPNENLKHPAKIWIEYHGGGDKAETLTFWDKEAIKEDGSRGKEVSLGKKIGFMFLDQTYSVTGWNDQSHSGMFSNEVKDISNGVMTAKAFKGQDSKVGTWPSIKDVVKSMGGKFTCNIYIAIKTQAGLELSVVQLTGAAFAAWNEFKKKVGDKAIESGAVKITGHKWGQKGSVKFCVPEFGLIPEVTPESDAAAIELDKMLQEYLASKIAAPTAQTVEEATPVQIQEPEPVTSIHQGPQGGGMGVVDFDEPVQESGPAPTGGFDSIEDDEEPPF